ncbi:uncharacterized protein LOC108148239 isoform X1 [Drosophila elegans]|uniref:uncharacterized protein LOC108148239 isoform X1 n=1 Tax=Drosophila elegans TaxID=30023 RepID=UPI0007E6B542|nr:uncharacterized protein LOC108148239 isoform X1 [Drosophila elegans]
MNRIDLTLDDMANNKFLTLYNGLIKSFTASTEFSSTEVISLLIVFYKYALNNGSRMMSTGQLYNLFLVSFGIFDVTIIDRISMNITHDGRSVSPEAWMRLFSVFFTGKLQERIKFAFQVYTSAGTVVLNREVVGLAIEKFFYGDDDDEINELRADMCEFLFAKFDTDKDGIIAFEEYAEIVQNQPGLLEFLGKIFPDDKDRSLVAYCHNIESILPPEDGY